MNESQWQKCKAAAWTVFLFVAILWAVEIVDLVLIGISFDSLGIHPRSLDGLLGIILWPFLHGNFLHLTNNTVPLLIMGWFVALRGNTQFFQIAAFISVLSGAMVWLFAINTGVHIGASGLVFGLFGYLVMRGIVEKSPTSALIAVGMVFFYGSSMIFGVLPIFPGISWEGHLFGAISGGVAAKVFNTPMPKLSSR